MNNLIKYLLSSLVVIIIFCIFSYILWSSISYFASSLSNSTETVKAASIAAIGSVVALLIGRFFEQRRESKQRLSAERIEIYKKFFDLYFSLFYHEKIKGSPKPEAEILSEMLEFQKDVIFWGSDRVIRAYLDLKDTMTTENDIVQRKDADKLHSSLGKLLSASSRLLVEMRKDVGYNFTSINAKDLARLQLATDPETRKIFDHI